MARPLGTKALDVELPATMSPNPVAARHNVVNIHAKCENLHRPILCHLQSGPCRHLSLDLEPPGEVGFLMGRVPPDVDGWNCGLKSPGIS